MNKRGISEKMVFDVVESPDQEISKDSDKKIYQSIKYFEKDKKEF